MDVPFALDLVFPQVILSKYDHHILRKLSSMNGQFVDQNAYKALLEKGDSVLYEVHDLQRP